MSEEEKLDQPNVKIPDSKKDKDKKEKKKRKNPIGKWFREMKSELKKVVWPTRKQIINNTVIVLVIVVISSVVLWCVDQAGSYIVNTLIKLGGH
ncbi:preprotein translocase subunit SecE [Sporobacter termitidis DSM 10068]|uniref:Protein translocase subunit SecE n=1 Tax=Sporobacter termitidis DSM 10068 TaxID=1123282 RepID=A0A1M5WBZ5_9FIRM|nr:preprotein translocase subunit SecE [Sporobacter termitidis]SHH84967.1 preprotein translocase subunit SecE [Sporobacter termitidis DSM 10068]